MLRSTALNVLRRPFSNAPRLTTLSRARLALTSRTFSSSRSTLGVHYVRFDNDPNRPRKRGWNQMTTQWAIALGIFGAYYIHHLEQVPETGRWRFMDVSPEFEQKIGKLARDEILQEHAHQLLPPNHPLSQHVRGVVSRILSASNLGHIRGEVPSPPNFLSPPIFAGGDDDAASWDPDSQRKSNSPSEREWEVVVVNDPNVVNAMATTGLIIVFTGILPICKDERGLAAVLAHEVGHVVARHIAESLSFQRIASFIPFLLYSLGFESFQITLSNVARNLFLDLPNSRKKEYEADKIGLRLMSQACYDPRAAVETFDRLHRLESSNTLLDIDFFRTHPLSSKRVDELDKLLPEAYQVLYANPDCAAIQDRFRSFQRFGEEVGGMGMRMRMSEENRTAWE